MYLVKIYEVHENGQRDKMVTLLGLASSQEQADSIVDCFLMYVGIERYFGKNYDMSYWYRDIYSVSPLEFLCEALHPTAPIKYFDIRAEPYSELNWGREYEFSEGIEIDFNKFLKDVDDTLALENSDYDEDEESLL